MKINKLLIINFILMCLLITSCAKKPLGNEKQKLPAEKQKPLYEIHKKDSLALASSAKEIEAFLKPKWNANSNKNVLKIEDEKWVEKLKDYKVKKDVFYKKYPLEKLIAKGDYIPFACRYFARDSSSVEEVNATIENADDEATKKLFRKLNYSFCEVENSITDPELSNYIISSLSNPYLEDDALLLIKYLGRGDKMEILEKHLISGNSTHKANVIWELIKNQSEVGYRQFKDLIRKEKDSILLKPQLNRILNYISGADTTGEFRNMNDSIKQEFTWLAINEVYTNQLKNSTPDYLSYKFRVSKLSDWGYFVINDPLSKFIEAADERIIPFLLEIKTNIANYKNVDLDYINYKLMRLGYKINEKEFKKLLNDKGVLMHMFLNKIKIKRVQEADNIYEVFFKDYVSSRKMFNTKKYIAPHAMSYFISVNHTVFKNKIEELIEENDTLELIGHQKEKAGILIDWHKKIKHSESEILQYLTEINFLDKEEAKAIKDSIKKDNGELRKISDNLNKVIFYSNKQINLINGYEGALEQVELSKNKYLKNMEVLTWRDTNKKIAQICIFYHDEAYFIGTNRNDPNTCQFEILVKLINFILSDNHLNERLIPFNKISCNVYQCYIGNKTAIKKIMKMYYEE